MRYKIKLVAANYLPAMTAALPHTQVADATRRPQAKVPSASDDRNAGAMTAGKSYPFHLALTNPLYDPIQVRLSVQRMHVTAVTDSTAPEKARRTPFAVSLPTSSFPVAAFAEAWEYDDDDEMFGLEDDELGLEMGRTRDKDGKGKVKTVGVLEKRANVTVVGGEVVIGKEARGHVKVRTEALVNPLLLLSSSVYSLICLSPILIDPTIHFLQKMVPGRLLALQLRRPRK